MPKSSAGHLNLEAGELRFADCASDSATAVTDLPDSEGAALVRELGDGKRIPALVRLDDGRLAGGAAGSRMSNAT